MKKIFPIILAAVLSLAVGSCDMIPQPAGPDGSQYAADPELEILSKDVVFMPQGGSGSIVVNTSEALSAHSSRPWLKVEVNGNRVTLTVDRNDSIESRYSNITLKAGKASVELVAQQFGVNSAYAWDDSYTFPYPGGELTLPYGEAGTVWVDLTQAPWVSAEVDEEKQTIHFTVAKSIYNYEREAPLTITVGESFAHHITFVQEPNPAGLNPGEEEPHEFVLQAAWTPKYVEPVFADQDYSVVGVDVDETLDAGRYFIKVVPQSEYNASGDEQLFLNRNAVTWAEEAQKYYGVSATEEIEKLGNGSYRVYAIGIDNAKKVNYTYAVATFKVTKYLSPYEKFLGTWSVVRGSYEDTWTIVEKEPGKSYTITGLEGDSQAFLGEYEITAEFDPSDNSFSIKTHMDLGQYTFNNSGKSVTVTMRLTGLVTYDGSPDVPVGGNYTICKVSLTGDGEMTVTAGPDLSLQGASGSFPLTGMRLNGLEGTSSWSFDNRTPYHFPFTATQLTQGDGSGDDDPDTPDDPDTGAYGKWIGNWNIDGTEFTIEEDEKDASYIISGFADFPVQALFNKADGKLWFVGQMLDEDSDYQYVFAGRDSEKYMELGDADNDYLLATATISADGKTASIVTHEYDAVYGGVSYHEIIIMMTVWGVPQDESDPYVYTFEGMPQITVPSTMKKASSAYVPSVRSASYDMRTGQFTPIYKTFKAGTPVPYKRR